MEETIQIGYTWPSTTALGPGHRFVIWVQGCNRRCPGCTSPELQSLSGGREMAVSSLANEILDTAGIDGITISGGEPLLQWRPIAALLEKIKTTRDGITVIVFTGYKKEDLSTEIVTRLFPYVDLLIDGEYIRELNDNKGLRGSSNQHLYFLSDALVEHKDFLLNGERRRESHLVGPEEVLTIGIAPGRN